jgi:hypothetical protein
VQSVLTKSQHQKANVLLLNVTARRAKVALQKQNLTKRNRLIVTAMTINALKLKVSQSKQRQ